MPSLPTGVVTFLFSDIEASTRILEDHRAAAGPAFARHHELLAAEIAAADGVIFETVGDAVYGAFEQPADALAAAVAVHRRLLAEDWGDIGALRVRIAVHSGPVEVRGDHYFGPALFECARMQALAHGGQTLASAAAVELAGTPPAGVSVQALGLHRLKDLAVPMEIVQVDGDGLPTRFPPLRSAMTVPSNLPDETTTFIGRDEDLARVSDLIAEHRLVTLLGPGGTGKTRLAIKAAARQLDRFPDGVWLVELAPVGRPDLVIAELADVWGLRAGEGSSLEEVVTRYLATRHLLLVVDNCEHVRDATATLLRNVLRAAPDVAVVATSRETLGIAGETEYRVPALALPDDGSDAAASDAIRLFIERVRALRPDFVVAEADLAAIVRICRRLEGMPLGIELAAARIRVLSPAELADRLDASFQVLGSSKGAVDRQRTLEATLDWSHALLTPDEQAVFRRLAVFAGGFDIEAAEAVAGGGSIEVSAVLDHLDSLVDKSLVVSVPDVRARFRLLEPIRQYAEARLVASEESDAIRTAHARHFASFVAEAAPMTRGPEQMAWERRLDLDYGNIRLAFERLLEAGDVDRHLDMGFDLFVHWMHQGLHVEGIATLLAGLERAPATTDPVRLVKAWWSVAGLGSEITDPASIEHARAGLAIASATNDPNLIGRMKLQLGASINHSTTDPAYLEHLLEGRRLLEANPEPYWWEPEWERGFLNLLLEAYLPAEDERVIEHTHAALDAFERVGDRAMLAAALGDSAGLWGQVDEAWILDNLARSVAILGELQVPYWHGHALLMLGSILEQQGDLATAADHLAEAAGHLQEMGDLNCWAGATRRLATADAALGSPDTARARLSAVIDALPRLPMVEVHTPRILDASVEVLLSAGRDEAAAFALGRAQATEFPGPTIFPREARLETARSRIIGQMGVKAAERHIDDGAGSEPEAALARIADALRVG